MKALHSMPGHLVRRVHQVSSALFASECGRFDITPVQYAALVAIDGHPGLDATRLSTVIAFDRSTIGDVLERLEAKGWVQRRPSPFDRRAKQLELTGAGRDLLTGVADAVDRVQERLLERLDAREQAVFLALLARIAEQERPDTAVSQTIKQEAFS